MAFLVTRGGGHKTPARFSRCCPWPGFNRASPRWEGSFGNDYDAADDGDRHHDGHYRRPPVPSSMPVLAVALIQAADERRRMGAPSHRLEETADRIATVASNAASTTKSKCGLPSSGFWVGILRRFT